MNKWNFTWETNETANKLKWVCGWFSIKVAADTDLETQWT